MVKLRSRHKQLPSVRAKRKHQRTKHGDDSDSSWSLGKAERLRKAPIARKRTKTQNQIETDSSSNDLGKYRKVLIDLHFNDRKTWTGNPKIQKKTTVF